MEKQMECYLDKSFWSEEDYKKLLELKKKIEYQIALLKAELEYERRQIWKKI